MEINKKYLPLLSKKTRTENNIRYVMLIGGRGSGKSTVVNQFLHNCTFEKKNVILSSRFTASSAEISIMPGFENAIMQRNTEKFFKITKRFLKNMYSNASIYFLGLKSGSKQQTAKLKSFEDLNIWVLDEAEELHDEEAFDDIDKSIRRKDYENLIVLVFNTYRITKNHFIYKKFYEKNRISHDFNGIIENVLYIHTSYLDNIKNLDTGFLRSLEIAKSDYSANEEKKYRENSDYYFSEPYFYEKKTKSPIFSEKFRCRYMGEFPETMEGRVYENVTYIDKIPDNAKRLPYGLDFGYTAPAAMVEVFYLDGGIYINEMLYESGLSNLDNLEYPEIKSLQNRLNAMNLFRNTPIVCDSAEPKSIRDLQLKGFNLVPTRKYAGSVKDMVTVVQNYPLFITKRSTNVIFEVENYVYSENLNQQGEKVPVKKNDHAMNALEYAVFSKGILW